MKFAELGLGDKILKAISETGYTDPTPIQEQSIPIVLQGRDILGCAQTGTGKTASFTIPMIEVLSAGQPKARMPRSLIIEPTRELAAQVAEDFMVLNKYQSLSYALLIGGVKIDEQIKLIDRGVDVLIVTPGRLLDLTDNGRLLLSGIKMLVIDEVDRMLDMGFIPDVERIVKLAPPLRQTLFFSATMPKEIRLIAEKFLHNPKEITINPPSSVVKTVKQSLILVPEKFKSDALKKVLDEELTANALIFCNKKSDINKLCKELKKQDLNVSELHGDMSQPARTETLKNFKAGDISILICSDVAARGIDIEALPLVILFDIPLHPEDYVHRIGRTGRAGANGKAISISTPNDKKYIEAIEHLTNNTLEIINLKGFSISKIENENKNSINKKAKSKKIINKKTVNENKADEEDCLGMGKHVPAFMLINNK